MYHSTRICTDFRSRVVRNAQLAERQGNRHSTSYWSARHTHTKGGKFKPKRGRPELKYANKLGDGKKAVEIAHYILDTRRIEQDVKGGTDKVKQQTRKRKQ